MELSSGVVPNAVKASALAVEINVEIQRAISVYRGGAEIFPSGSYEVIQCQGSRDGATLSPEKATQMGVAMFQEADRIFTRAENRLADLGPQANAQISFLQGTVHYYRWMVANAQYTKSATPQVMTVPTTGSDAGATRRQSLAEGGRLDLAIARFEEAYSLGLNREIFLFLYWGNALRAARRFDDSVRVYRLANELAPTDYRPLLNTAHAMLDNVIHAPAETPSKLVARRLNDAIQHVADHLSWASTGGPYGHYVTKIEHALQRWHADHAEPAGGPGPGEQLRSDFAGCLAKHKPECSAPDVSLRERAQLKICVDQVRKRLHRHGLVQSMDVGRQAPEKGAVLTSALP
jgi:tetratricopeptide (TPR) repeat protein